MGEQITKVEQFKGVLNSQQIRAQIKNSLQENAGAFMSSMIDLYNGDTYLQKCNPEEVALECVKAAALKLPLVKSLGFAYVVPYKNKPTFTIGYKGLIQLAQRTGQYKTINADCVYEGELKNHSKLSGEIDLSGERKSDKVIGYFAYIKLVSGFEKILYMSLDDVKKWGEKYSPSFNSSYSPWRTEFDKMAIKTALRRLIGTYGAMTIEMQEAFENDDKGITPKQEIENNANKQVIDITPKSTEEVYQADNEQENENEDKPPIDNNKQTDGPGF